MKMIDNERIRIVNSQGIDTIYNFKEEQVEAYFPIEDFEARFGEFKDPHILCERIQYNKNDSCKRLMDHNKDYRQHVDLMTQLNRNVFAKLFQKHSTSLQGLNAPKTELEYQTLERNMKIFRIERYFNEKTQTLEPFVQLSFTALDWIAINKIMNKSSSNDHELMSEVAIVRMVYNQLPINRSFLEMLVLGENQQKVRLLRHFFKICNTDDFSEFIGPQQPQIPLIRNLEGKTALDWTL